MSRLTEKASRLNGWNYRVVRRSADVNGVLDESFQLIEAYYDQNGEITAWCDAVPGGNDVTDLFNCCQRMTNAVGMAHLSNPVFAPVEYDDLPGRKE